MDPITAINLEFVREVREDWSKEAPTQDAQDTPRAHPRLTAQMRTTVGKALIAMGMWLSGRTAALATDATDAAVSQHS